MRTARFVPTCTVLDPRAVPSDFGIQAGVMTYAESYSMVLACAGPESDTLAAPYLNPGETVDGVLIYGAAGSIYGGALGADGGAAAVAAAYGPHLDNP